MAMTEKEKIEKLLKTKEVLLKERHNLKRRLKRCEPKMQKEKETSNVVDFPPKFEKVSVDFVKNKCRELGMNEKEIEVTIWGLSDFINFQKK